jgi:hypothetical protein
MPTLAVSPAGVLAISFNGLRESPAPRKPCAAQHHVAHTLLDEYLTSSTDLRNGMSAAYTRAVPLPTAATCR